MPINFSRPRQKSAYDTANNAGDFLPYLYQLSLNPTEDISIVCRTRTPATVRLRLSYGRHYITEQLPTEDNTPDPLFYPFADTARHVKVIVPLEHVNTLYLRAGPNFSEALAHMPETTIWNFFVAADNWLASPTQQAFTRRWQPALPEPYTVAVTRYIQLRKVQIPTANHSEQLTVLCKT